MKEEIEKKFKDIYEKESDPIFRFCLTRVSDREQALDITQEVFMRLWKNLQEGKNNIQNHRAFLFTIARNLIIDWYRKKKSVSLENIIEQEGETFDQIDQDVMINVELKSDSIYVLSKVSKLSATYQTPIYLRFIEDLTITEISEILKISANATSVRINRGLEELRKIIENENQIK